MGSDVYVCYDDEDREIAEDVYSALKNSRLKCWMKSRDVRADVVKEMMEAIHQSHVMVLIYSEHAKFSDYVNTEVDVAFSNEIPIMVFRTDDSKIEGALEFFLRPQPKFNAYSDPDGELERLIKRTSEIVKKGKTGSILDFIKANKIPIAVCLAVILIAASCIYMFVPLDDVNSEGAGGQIDSINASIKVTDFHVDDVHKKGYSWNYSYYVSGTISPMLPKEKGYVITSDFYDKSGNLINKTEVSADDLQIVNDGFILGSTASDTNDIARVEVQLLNGKDIVLAQSESQLKNFK